MLFLLFVYLRVAEAILPGTKFHRYMKDGNTLLRSTSLYSVHEDVYQHLDFGKQLHLYIICLK